MPSSGHHVRFVLRENKGMVSPAPSDVTSPTVRVNISSVVEKDHSSQPTKIKFKRWITVPYGLNALLLVFVLSLLVLAEYGYIPGSKLGFICEDPYISHKFRGEVISPLVLGIGSLLIPIITLLLTEVLSNRTFSRIDYCKVWYFYRECAIGCVFVLTITQIAKVLVGEHRPHFFDVCQPDTAKDCVVGTFIESYTCTNTKYNNYFLVDSSKSFPSGHSSVSWFIGLFSAYIIQTRLPTSETGRLLKPFLIAVCLTWSLICSLTRISDRRHHWWDVLAGTMLGVVGAVYTITLVHRKMNTSHIITKDCSSTTTLLDVKNKEATSVII
ncbi:phospholipid phosphatase 1 isoform X3 [Leptinotarsa decemlineata]|uniref:phospholipid phosphatase 1 isoform X3 n=1 Tax=Leptinotarsa decemlineata TaxID=7539 RepID=UPI003D305F48